MNNNALPPVEDVHLNGQILYGDDFDEQEILAWFNHEKLGYYDLYNTDSQEEQEGHLYEHINNYYAFAKLRGKTFKTCLALGCADGDDVKPLAGQVEKFIAIEPAKEWWRDRIGTKPATYMMPESSGRIPLQNESVDLAISLGVLHHIPNVSYVLEEIHRTLSVGGYFVAREPISSMGDFRSPRSGCTKYERGIPIEYLKRKLWDLGYTDVAISPALFSPLVQILKRTSRSSIPRSRMIARFDAMLSRAFAFNDVYFRNTFWKKFAPGACFIIAKK